MQKVYCDSYTQINQDKLRDSNLELFRIITMLLIVAHHYVVNSGLIDLINSSPLSGATVFLSIFGAWGKTGKPVPKSISNEQLKSYMNLMSLVKKNFIWGFVPQ